MSGSKPEILKKIKLLNDLTLSELEKIEACCNWRRYGAQAQIIDHQSDTKSVFFVTEGRVRVVNYSFSGREITLCDIQTGGYFGELAAIDSKPRSASVLALIPCEVAIMAQADFISLVRARSDLALKLMRDLTSMVRLSTERIMELSTVAANNRVHFELLRRARNFMDTHNSAEIRPIPLHSELASCVSTTRETVSRVMNQLARKGLVERRKNSIVISDINRLNNFIHND